MNLLSVENVSKSYDGMRVLFKGVSFGIDSGEKVALVAKNGTGKTTLLKMIAGLETPDSGSVTTRKDIRIAFLNQDPKLDPSRTVLQVVFDGDSPELNIIREYERLLETYNDLPNGVELLGNAQQRMDELNAWDHEARIKQILSELGIEKFDQLISELSGGQVKRVALSSTLIREPELLIMDEPTNHLDMEMTEWLENYLASREIALLIVTHDRYFLDRVCTEILELEDGEMFRYKGNYSYYVEKKAEREIQRESEQGKARNLYRRELEWVRKMPRARGTKAKARVDAFDDVKEKALKKRSTNKLDIAIKTERLGGKIIEAVKVGKAFGDKKIVNNFSYTFTKGEKIGVVGKNGSGKSTLLNMLQGLEPPDAGKITLGETVVFGYYSQGGMVTGEEKRVIEVVRDIAEYIPLANGMKLSAGQLLERFLFAPETQYAFVSRLSGGEKRRLFLCTILMKNPNFLIMDEPTNDLDIVTLSALEDFLVEFPGCLLIVSHDRYFMDRVVDHIFVFEGNGELKDFPGNYSEYREWKLSEEGRRKRPFGKSSGDGKSREQQTRNKEQGTEDRERTTDNRQPTTSEAVTKKRSYKEQREFEQLEKEIPELEAHIKMLEERISNGTEYDEIQILSKEYQEKTAELERKTMRWIELSE
jgi:ABC transport system ATP-binding/permease protein